MAEALAYRPGDFLIECLRKAWTRKYHATEELAYFDNIKIKDSPRWPSGVSEVDVGTNGGFYGVTVLGGQAGVGKSMVAMASATEAAQQGIKVIYLAGEMTRAQLAQRAYRRLGADIIAVWGTMLRIYLLHEIASMRDFGRIIAGSIDPEDEQIVVVYDSIDTIAGNLTPEDAAEFHIFRIKNRITNMMVAARRLSEGRIGSLLINELNTQGNIKGRKLEYLCDLDVRLKHGDMDDHIELDVAKGREGGRKSYGLFYMNWRKTALEGARE